MIDVGGGLAIRYADETPMDPVRFAEAVVPLLAPTGYTVYLEPGRYLVGSAGVLLTEVLYRKHSGGKEFVVVDAGMNDLVRPSHYQAYHEIVELESRERPTVRADIVGPVCETGDFLALDRELPDVQRRRPSRRARRRRLRVRDGLELQHASAARGSHGGWRPLVGRPAAGDGGGSVSHGKGVAVIRERQCPMPTSPWRTP